MKIRLIAGIAAACGICTMSVQAGVPVYECQGTYDYDPQSVSVDLDADWAAMTARLDFDDEGGCDTGGEDGVVCTPNGKNTKTSTIDDFTAFSGDFTAPLGDPWENNDVAGNQYATVFMDVFMPGDCAVALAAGDAECDGDVGTTDDVCYESASGAFFETAAESCADTFDFNGEGMFAEGEPYSDNRHPKSGRNQNWSMYVDLGAEVAACGGATDETDTGGVCDQNSATVRAIADGGDFGEPGAVEDVDYLNVGDVTFALDDNCEPVCVADCPE